MANVDSSRDESLPLSSVELSKEAMQSLTCSICLELLYKPVVTACGHMFCFWCGHHGMNALTASNCPLCRRPFIYFPRICKLLHFMLMKAVPVEYVRRGYEARRYEEELEMFSPEFAMENSDLDSLIPPESEHGDASTTSTKVDTRVVTKNEHDMQSSPENNSQCQCAQEVEDTSRQGNLTKDDLCCALCNDLLYRPVVLNCGDVFCEPCLKMHNFKVHCPVCSAPHPAGSVLVCLELDQFVKFAFPLDYTRRQLQHPAEHTPSPDCDGVDLEMEGNLHFGVGCDGCGMFPIIGDCYHCEDCEEVAGYDLCGRCHNNSGNLMGRFNQKHQPTHHMRKVSHTHHIEKVLSRFRFAGFTAD